MQISNSRFYGAIAPDNLSIAVRVIFIRFMYANFEQPLLWSNRPG